MKLREDSKILSGLVGSKIISLEEAKTMSALALMDIPYVFDMPEYMEWFTNSKLYVEKIYLNFHQFPFYEMVYFTKMSGPEKITRANSIGSNGHYYCKIVIKDENTAEFQYTDDPQYLISTTVVLNEKGAPGFNNPIIRINANIPAEEQKRLMPLLADLHFKKPRGDNENKAYVPHLLLTMVPCWVMFNDQLDRYSISVSKNKKPKLSNNREGEIAKVAGPRIIYLDKLPETTDKDPESSSTGLTVAPHQRRGTWVTLRAERFKNHPLFQVEKGIYRKPAWVGDRTRIVHGATYTVIDKQINLEK